VDRRFAPQDSLEQDRGLREVGDFGRTADGERSGKKIILERKRQERTIMKQGTNTWSPYSKDKNQKSISDLKMLRDAFLRKRD
jgi:hypothetical protein